MKLVEVKKYALDFTAEDWAKLGELMSDAKQVCDTVKDDCSACPLYHFCYDHQSPYSYFKNLYEFLDN